MVLIETPVASWKVAGNREGGEHDGQAVIDRAQVQHLVHVPPAALDLEQLLVAQRDVLGRQVWIAGAAAALRSWMDNLLDYLFTKHALRDALPAILAARDGLRSDSRSLLRSAVARLLAAGAADGSLRGDIAPNDLLLGLGGITMIATSEQQRTVAATLFDLLMDGLRAGGTGQPDSV